MNKAGSRIYIYIFTLLFIGEDSSALSEISSVFGCGGDCRFAKKPALRTNIDFAFGSIIIAESSLVAGKAASSTWL